MYFQHLRNLGGILAALLLLTACGKPAVTESSESMSEPVSEYATTDVSDHRKVSMDFDNIQPAGYSWSHGQAVPQVEDGFLQYFTIERDGKWGLILADGTQILPCLSNYPVNLCNMEEWIWCSDKNMDYNPASKESMLLTDIPLCIGHGGGRSVRFVDLKSETKKPQIHFRIAGGGGVEEVTQLRPETNVATYFCDYIVDAEIPYLSDDGYWNFTNQSGKVLFPEEQFSMVSDFKKDQPAAVQKNGKWAYVSGGHYVTDFIYESCWFELGEYDEQRNWKGISAPIFAYPFHRGFAPVKKDGKWGVIDMSGIVWVPCEYEGAAPHPLGVWLKKDGIWETRVLDKYSY